MQMVPKAYFRNRIVYYLAKFHQQQLHEGEDYSVLKPTISIVFLNQVHHAEASDYHLRFRLIEELHHFLYSGDLEIHVLELPKFKKSEAELSTGLEIWLYFLQHVEKMDPEALPSALSGPLFAKAVKELVMLSQTDIERERYEARRKAQLDYNSGLKGARLEGEAEGLAKGKIGVIQFCERLLGLTETATERLQSLSLEELTKLADDLQNQVLSQRR
jgi:predicted transposase/invertase (TIGR01784 family)